MIDKGIVSVSIDIAAQIFCDFEAVKVESKTGIILMQVDDEKKNVKKNLCIAFYPEQKQIMLKNGGVYHALKVLSGNEENFDGEYKIEFFGQEGVVNVQKKGEI